MVKESEDRTRRRKIVETRKKFLKAYGFELLLEEANVKSDTGNYT